AGAVGHDVLALGAEVELELHLATERATQDAAERFDHRIELDGADLDAVAAAEGEELLGELGGAPARLDDLRDELPVLLGYRAHEDLARAEDDGEEVVEVVGDAADEPAQGFEALRVVELALGVDAHEGRAEDAADGGHEVAELERDLRGRAEIDNEHAVAARGAAELDGERADLSAFRVGERDLLG